MTAWAEMSPAPGLQGELGASGACTTGNLPAARRDLPPLGSLPGAEFILCLSCVHPVSLTYPLPICPGAQRHGGGGGRPRTQEVPCGGLWARPELAVTPGGKDIPRSAEKPPLPPAPRPTLP